MKIKKRGKYFQRKRIKAKCSTCGSVILLDKDDYRLGGPEIVRWYCFVTDSFQPEQIGRHIIWKCPVCNEMENTLRIFHWKKFKVALKKLFAY